MAGGIARAAEAVKIGLILPMTGPSASTGKQIDMAVKLYQAQNGDMVAGRKIEVLLRDDGGVADTTRRIAQELVVKDHVSALMGFGLTPLAMATAPIATQAKIPMIVTAAATSIITEKSPFIVRTAEVIPQLGVAMADWSLQNGIKKVVTLVSDYAPGFDAEHWFSERFKQGGGTVLASLRVPLANPDFAPFLQRAMDAKPDALFTFVPSGFGAVLAKQFVERGMAKSGIRLIGTGDVTDDDQLDGMGDAVLGMVTAGPYSAAHPSAVNKAYVAAFEKANGGKRPNFMATWGYDGIALFYKALAKTKGDTNGTKLVDAMKGMSWESPRGPLLIDPQTRDAVHNIYIRKVEKVDGHLFNVEMSDYPMMKDPAKAAGK
ncbi:MAG: ABC transporter substrate-binding protein [Rhodospirillales bacterium]|nr:ABC transporter substrate-binding protein [Rhodospirillales bacterium]MDE2575512.1 ABC transporter substrate-binding protein [Rhodospirillales bacterium]